MLFLRRYNKCTSYWILSLFKIPRIKHFRECNEERNCPLRGEGGLEEASSDGGLIIG